MFSVSDPRPAPHLQGGARHIDIFDGLLGEATFRGPGIIHAKFLPSADYVEFLALTDVGLGQFGIVDRSVRSARSVVDWDLRAPVGFVGKLHPAGYALTVARCEDPQAARVNEGSGMIWHRNGIRRIHGVAYVARN